MKILQVITSLQFGGAEKLISEIAPLLRDRGMDSTGSPTNTVDVCSFVATEPNLNKVLEGQGIKVINFAAGGRVYNPAFIWKLAKLMKRYDVVHTHNTACQMFAAIGSILLKVSKGFTSTSSAQAQGFQRVSCCPKLVTTEHSTSTRRRGHKLLEILDKWMYARYDKIICISEPSEESLRNYLSALISQLTL